MSQMRTLNYMALLDRFLRKEVATTDFEREYLAMFKEERSFLPDEVFCVLDRLFGDVDALCMDPELFGEGDVSEEQLRQRCALALKELRALLKAR